jgi:hypothetical protein
MLVSTAWHPLPQLQHTAANVPADLTAVVDRAMAFDPAERYPSAAGMWVDLAHVQRRL